MLTTSGASERRHEVEELVPARRVLGQHQPCPRLAEGAHREAPRHLLDGTPWRPARRARRRPQASAATAAIRALDWLNRPGSASRTGALLPSAHSAADRTVRRHHQSVASGAGRAKPQSAHDQPPSVNSMRPSQDGQPTASCCQRRPAATQCTSRAAPAPQTTSGSSALATTWVCGAAASAARQRPGDHAHLVGPIELVPRQVQQDHGGRRCRREHPRQVDLVGLEHGAGACPSRPARPRGRGACSNRSRCSTTASPVAPRPTMRRRVVVVFPLVPVTSATWRPALRCSSSRGSRRSPARPPATVPWPRPRRREAALTARVVALASRALTEGACCEPAPRRSARGAPATRGQQRARWPP